MTQFSKKQRLGAGISAAAAGILNGLLGGAGGMVLVPGLRRLAQVPPEQLFPTSVCIMLPTTLCSLCFSAAAGPLPLRQALPYLAAASLGGLAAGLWGKRIPVLWLHRSFGALLVLGGLRTLW